MQIYGVFLLVNFSAWNYVTVSFIPLEYNLKIYIKVAAAK